MSLLHFTLFYLYYTIASIYTFTDMSQHFFHEYLLNHTKSLGFHQSNQQPPRPYSGGRAPTSAEIDAVIAAAIANAPPAPSVPEIDRSVTPLMTNLLPSAVGTDGRVNLFVGNVSSAQRAAIDFGSKTWLTIVTVSCSMARPQRSFQKGWNGVTRRCQPGAG